MGYDLKLRVWRGDAGGGALGDYTVEVSEGEVVLERKPVPKMRDELITLFDRTELSKYLTEDELAEYDALTGEAK